MKKLIFPFFITLLFCHFSTFAGHNEQRRSSCRILAKYKAGTHLGTSSGFGASSNTGCSWAQDQRSLTFFPSTCTAVATSTSNASTLGGSIHTCSGIWGGISSPLFNWLGFKVEEAEAASESNSEKYSVNFSNTVVQINNLQIQLVGNNTPNKINVFEIYVWLPNDSASVGDTVRTASKTVHSGKVVLENGVVSVTGDIFSLSNFAITVSGGQTFVTYIGSSTINLPISVNLNNVDVIVSSSGDIVPSEESIFSALIADSQNDSHNVTLYPVPTNSNLNYSFNTGDEILSVKLFDKNGFEISNTVAIDVTTNVINVSGLVNDKYYVCFEFANQQKVLKSFIKN